MNTVMVDRERRRAVGPGPAARLHGDRHMDASPAGYTALLRAVAASGMALDDAVRRVTESWPEMSWAIVEARVLDLRRLAGSAIVVI